MNSVIFDQQMAQNNTSTGTASRITDAFVQDDDARVLAALYDEYAAVVLGFLERIADDREKAEELLQAVFLALPARLHEFDPQKGRRLVWILRLARSISQNGTNSTNAATNGAIRTAPDNVSEMAGEEPAQHVARRLTPSPAKHTAEKVQSVIELLYVKGYTFAEAAKELNIDEAAVKILIRTELKKYRRGQA